MDNATERKFREGYGAGSLFVAALGGALVGGIAALLMAPRTGQETRQRIVGYYDDAKERVDEVKEKIEGKIGSAKNRMERVPEALKSASQAATKTFADDLHS